VCATIVLTAAGAVFFLPMTPRTRQAATAGQSRTATVPVFTKEARQRLANLGWVFEPNVGQSSPKVKFLSRAPDATVFLTSNSVYVSWAGAPQDHPDAKQNFVKLEFAGAGRGTRLVGDSPLRGKTNYLLGRNASQWHVDVPHYGEVRYAGLYPGVDARFYGSAEGFEYDLTAARGSDPRRILLHVANADQVHIDGQGSLVMQVGARRLTMKRPQIYQIEWGARKNINGGYRLLSGEVVGFEIGHYRHDLPLIIDPSISIAYTTFLGGAGAEHGSSVAVDSSGNVYVGGTTTLPSFPEQTTPFTGSSGPGPLNGTSSLFVAKIDPSQTGAASLVYLTFIGGSGSDQGGMVALDNSANPPNLAILGWSTSNNFPTTIGTLPAGTTNLTVSDLNSNGNGFIYSEYFGGSGAEATQNVGGIATDSAGDVFITSDTTSSNLPVTPAAIVPTFVGPDDGLLAEFTSGTGAVAYCTYLGLNAQTVGGAGVAIDASGNAYVAGFTSTTTTTFSNTFQATYPGGSLDGFVMEVNPNSASGLVYGGFIGGTQSDQALSIAVDTSTPPDAYVSGLTQSSNLIPSSGVTNSPFQSTLAGTQNGFFAVINQSGAAPVLQYETYLGGNGTDAAQGVTVFSPSQVFIAGNTTSADFPALCSLQGFSGSQDAFLAEFNPSVGGTSSLLYTTFLGGTATAEANAVGADSSGNAIIFGDTLSHDYPLAQNPQTGFQITCTSCTATPALSDALLTKVNVTAGAAACVAFSPSAVSVGSFADGTSAPPENLVMTNDGSANLSVSSITVTGTNSTDFSQTNTCLATSPITPTGTCTISITFTPSIVGPETAVLQITDNGVGSPQMLNLSGTGTAVGVTLLPNTLSFPSTPQGQVSSAQTATVTNTSSDTLSIQQASIQGANPTDFEYATANNCGASITIAPGNSCTIAIQFAPNEPSPPLTGLALTAQDSLTILDTTNQSTETVSVALSGTEVPTAPAIVFAPTSLTFGGENVGGATAPQQITVTNNGSAPLLLSTIGITGANPGDFSQTNTCPSSLAINSNCTISVTFQPTATGPRSADVSVADNASGSPQAVPVSGTGTAAGVSLTPLSLTFVGQNPGTPASPPQTVTLQNTGSGPLTISSIAITGTNAGDFPSPGNNCPISPATLSAGNSCSILVTFAPTATGARSASLAISDNAIPSPQIVGLSGTGTMPSLQFGAPGVSFSGVVGGQGNSKPLQINDVGNGPLVITGVAFVGADSNDFQASGGCIGAGGAAVTVAAGSSCTLIVNFVPAAAGSFTVTLAVTDNAPNSPQQIPVSGTATDFQLGPISGGATSVTVTAGDTATFSMQVTPSNGFAGTVFIASANPMPASTCTISPSQMTISGNSPVGFTVTVTTTAPPTTSGGSFFRLPISGHGLLLAGLWLLAFVFVMRWRGKSKRWRLFRPAWLLVGALLLSSCNGGGTSPSMSGTPAGTYTITITGTSSGVNRTLSLSITVQ
jgi:hypothetical protein